MWATPQEADRYNSLAEEVMDPPSTQELIVQHREERIREATRIIDRARAHGIVLRLVGGLAVRYHCKSLDFCERDYGDIDLVGHRRDANRIAALLLDLGYPEDMHVRLATGGRQLQFGTDAHVDVFLDTFKMEHAVDLTDRLPDQDYTVTASDLLLTKLQMARLEEKDERDVFTLLGDLDIGPAEDPRALDPAHIARLCARDWGLFHDVQANLDLLRGRVDTYESLPAVARDRVLAALQKLQEAMEAEPKPTSWRLRARVGTRLSWRDEVEEQE